MIVTRKATIEDLPILLEFEQGIIKAEKPFDVTLKDENISYYDIKELIVAEDAEVIVAIEDKRIIGSGFAIIKKAKEYLKHEDFVHLGFMYIEPFYRGKGVNKLIIETLNKWAYVNGIYEVRLSVYSGNIAAIKAYEKANFKKHIVNMRIDLKNQ
ncbi:GNAT family N-acetyltransferase [Tenacibaculum sp.]|nr:GNAT family N-acetyltransferase [Tenacibaculum sp.]